MDSFLRGRGSQIELSKSENSPKLFFFGDSFEKSVYRDLGQDTPVCIIQCIKQLNSKLVAVSQRQKQ